MHLSRVDVRMVPPVATAAVVWCCLFALLHLNWALGGSAGLAASAGADLASRRPAAFVLLGLWGVVIALLIAASVIAAVTSGMLSSTVERLGTWGIMLAGIGLLARGAGLEVLLAIGVGGIRDAVGPLESRWSLIFWNPWFVLGAAAFIGTGAQHLKEMRTKASPR